LPAPQSEYVKRYPTAAEKRADEEAVKKFFILYNIKRRKKVLNDKKFFLTIFINFVVVAKIPSGPVIAPIPYQTGFQESTSVAIDLILLFHEDLIFYMLYIMLFLG
jgi:hypothetical protein